jgi:hypothetical protein
MVENWLTLNGMVDASNKNRKVLTNARENLVSTKDSYGSTEQDCEIKS